MSRPLEDYAMIGDGETAALVSRDGAVDWLCWPRFDSDTCFAALLGASENGSWQISPETTICAQTRRYQADTLVLETDFESDDGAVRLIDFMPRRQGFSSLVRIVVGLRGTVKMRSQMRMRFDFGAMPPWCEATADGAVAKFGPHLLALRTKLAVTVQQQCLDASFTITAGARLPFVLSHCSSSDEPPEPIDAEAALAATQSFWREWIGRFDANSTNGKMNPNWATQVKRSLITLKALVYQPSGGLIAAPPPHCPRHRAGHLTGIIAIAGCEMRPSPFARC
jgi:GH15 family glucan-1,4-alpha-glucosidase